MRILLSDHIESEKVEMNLTLFNIDGLTLYGVWVDLLRETLMINCYNNEVMILVPGRNRKLFL